MTHNWVRGARGGFLAAFLVLFAGVLLAPSGVRAQSRVLPETITEPTSTSCGAWRRVSDYVAEADCTFSRARDKVIAVDRNRDGKLDFAEDTWLFDVSFNEGIELIVQFDKQGAAQEALIYDDVNSDRRVDYVLSGSDVTVTEATFPTVKLRADGDWWLPNGDLNYNVTITVDGAYLTIYGSTTPEGMRVKDGKPDWVYEMVDEERDGVPDYWTYRLLTQMPRTWNVTRFSTFVNTKQTKPQVLRDILFWPYLMAERAYENYSADPANYRAGTDRMFSTNPFVEIGWPIARVNTAGFRGYPIEQGWWVNSQSPIELDKKVAGNFENPHAWYDLAQDNDNNPELNVRVVYWNPNDPNYPIATYPFNEIRYSWNQANTEGLAFDYKLGLAAQHEVDSFVKVDEYDIQVVPFEDLPSWVVERPWNTVSFIVSEGLNYQSSEGIYEWAPSTSLDGVAERYVNGIDTTPPLNEFSFLQPKLRGEYALELEDQPWLYFSAIDRELHLRGSLSGMWRLSEDTFVHYANLGGDKINAWRLERNGKVLQRLYATRTHLVFTMGNRVMIREAAATTPLFETLPPTNHAEWKALGALLDRHEGDLTAGNLASMFAQFDGPDMVLEGVDLQHFQLTPAGFRFEADVDRATADGRGAPELSGLASGSYVFSFDGALVVEPATPPQLSLEIEIPKGQPLEQGVPIMVRVHAHNAGNTDAISTTFVLETAFDGAPVIVDQRRLDVSAEGDETVELSLPLWREGAWELRARLLGPEELTLASTNLAAGDVASSLDQPGSVLELSSVNAQLAILSLVVIVCGSVLAGYLALRDVREEHA